MRPQGNFRHRSPMIDAALIIAYVHYNHVGFITDAHSWLGRCRNFRKSQTRSSPFPPPWGAALHMRRELSPGGPRVRFHPTFVKHLLRARHSARSLILNYLHVIKRNNIFYGEPLDFFLNSFIEVSLSYPEIHPF